jgi:uncharacterized protein (TIGR02266 family)
MRRAKAPVQPFRKIRPAEKRQYARFEVFLPARCLLRGPDGEPLEVAGKTRNVSEGGLLVLLPQALPRGVPVTVELDTQTGPAARSGRVVWVGPPERTELGKSVLPHGIAFGQALERAYVEALVTHRPPRDPRAPVEVQVDYETVVSGHSVNLSRSGVFIRTAHPLPVSQTLTLRFHLPGSGEPFDVQGQVIWSNLEPGKTYPQGMGVRFLDLRTEQAERIGAFVAQVRRERGLERMSDLFGRPEEPEG